MKPEEIYELGEQGNSENAMKAKRKFKKKECKKNKTQWICGQEEHCSGSRRENYLGDMVQVELVSCVK